MRKFIGGTATLLTVLALAGCGNSQNSSNEKNKADIANNTSQVNKKTSSSSIANASTSKTKTSSSAQAETTPWDDAKDKKLADYINSWAPTMGQEYEKYDGQTDIKTNTGFSFPTQLDKTTVAGGGVPVWDAKGDGNNAYNVVAIYNDNVASNAIAHITYLFTFHDGQPIVLVDQSTNGDLVWQETQNTAVKSNFASIAGGSSASDSTATDDTDSTSSDSQQSASSAKGDPVSEEDAQQAVIKATGGDWFNKNPVTYYPQSDGSMKVIQISGLGGRGQIHWTFIPNEDNTLSVRQHGGLNDGTSPDDETWTVSRD